MKEQIANVIRGLSELISITILAMETERMRPGSNADLSDQKINDAKQRITVLRTIREQVENEMGK